VSRKSSDGSARTRFRGARTLACGVGQGHPPTALLIARQGRPSWMPVVNTRVNAHTRVNAQIRISTRPRIILDPRHQPRLHRILLDVPSNPIPLLLITNPMIVRLPLPERLASAAQQSIGLTRGRSLERFQEMGRQGQGSQEYVNVVCHDYEGPKLVMAEFDSAVEGVYNQLRDTGLPQVLGTRPRVVEEAVNPGKSFSGRSLGGWRQPACRKTCVQCPGYEQPAALGIGVGEPAARVHGSLVARRAKKSRVHISVNAARKSACATQYD
jgi:hypothetical protein